MSRVEVYSVGVCHASVCAANDATREEIINTVNDEHPTGVGPWTFSPEKTFSSGQPNPCPCEDIPNGRTHYLMVC